MVVAGVLIRTKPGTTKSVLDAIRSKDEVSYAVAVFGRYDIVTTMKDVKDIDEVAMVVTKALANLDGVVSTETLITANI